MHVQVLQHSDLDPKSNGPKAHPLSARASRVYTMAIGLH